MVNKNNEIDNISMKIFGKPAKDIKYLLVTNFIHQQLLDEELARTGLYQWLNVFNGEVKQPRDVKDYNDYDIVQVNLSGQDIHLVGDIREVLGEDSKTKLIVNNDYTTELWGGSFEYPSTIAREMIKADMIFGTEYYQTTAISELVGRQCYIVPHPADIKRLKSKTPLPKKNVITTIWRRYDNFTYIPSLVVRNHGLITQLIGYDKNVDKKVWLTSTLFDYLFAGTNYFDFCDLLRESTVIYDPFTLHSYSRTTVDTAALGIPVVGSNRTQSINQCYPHTSVDPYDVTRARLLIRKILDDKEFRDLVIKTALEKCEFYNHENSKERYLASLAESLRLGRGSRRKIVRKSINEKCRGDDIDILHAEEINNGTKKRKNKIKG